MDYGIGAEVGAKRQATRIRAKKSRKDWRKALRRKAQITIQLEELRAKRRQYAKDYNRKSRAEKSGVCQKRWIL